MTPAQLTPHFTRRRYLAALVAALLPPTAGAQPPLFVAEGEGPTLTVPAGAWQTVDAFSPILRVSKGGRARGRRASFETLGDSSHAVHVSDPNSELDLSGGSIHTRGVGSHGLYVDGTQLSVVKLIDMDILTEAASSNGATFRNQGASGDLRGGSITTQGYLAIGLLAEDGGRVSIENSRLNTGGEKAAGMIVRGKGSSLEANKVSILTGGEQAFGVVVSDTGTATLTDVVVKTTGWAAPALKADGASGQVTVTGGELMTAGNEAHGLFSTESARIVLRGTRIETSGASAAGVDNRAASVGLSTLDLVTHGANAYGILARGGLIPGRSPYVDTRDVNISTEGKAAFGAYARSGGRIQLDHSIIQTSGDNAHGLQVVAGTIATRDTVITTHGDTAYGAIVQAGGHLDLEGGSIISETSAALGLHDPGTVRIGGGAIARGGNGAFAEVDPFSTQAFTLVVDDEAQAIGDIRLSAEASSPALDETKFSLAVKSAATWTGSSSVLRHLSLESGGTWSITADSHIGSLRNDHGVIAFAPMASGSFGTLTIDGDYEGNDGLFRMRTQLGDDTSPADLVHVLGNTAGKTAIVVDALDGAGNYTKDGVVLVRVDGRSDGLFELKGRAVAGAHEYLLHKGSLSDPADGDWYLRSSLAPDPVVEPETKPKPETPGPEPIVVLPPEPPAPARLLRPEVGTYRANQAAALDMFQGGPGMGEDDEREDVHRSVWARFDRRHTAFDLRNELTTTASTSELTLGADILRGGTDTETHLGLMAAAGQSDTRATSMLTRYAAKGRVRGAAAGFYAGLRTTDGSYLRGWMQFAHLSQRVEGDALPNERYGSGVLSSSIEAGHRWRATLNRDTDVYLEPQAQLTAARLHGGDHTETNGTRVTPIHASGATSRIGMRTAARWHTPRGHIASPYVAASWIRRLGRMDATEINGETFGGGVPRNSYALKLGVTLLRNSGWRAWTDVETRFGTRRYRRVTGSLGIRRAW